MLGKTEVNGDKAEPVWEWMKEERLGLLGLRRIKWNFESEFFSFFFFGFLFRGGGHTRCGVPLLPFSGLCVGKQMDEERIFADL